MVRQLLKRACVRLTGRPPSQWVAAHRYRDGLALWFVKLVGLVPSQRVRTGVYRRVCGMRVGAGTVIYHGCEIRSPRTVSVGAASSVGDHCILDGRGGLSIGDSVNLSTGVWIWPAEHAVHDTGFAYTSAPVRIDDYAWVSCRAVVLPGVTIGRGAVVAAGAVVTKSVAPLDIVGGVPAKPIGRRSADLDYSLGSAAACW